MMDHVSVMGVDLSGMKSSRLSKKDAHYHSGHPAQNLNLILNENKSTKNYVAHMRASLQALCTTKIKPGAKILFFSKSAK